MMSITVSMATIVFWPLVVLEYFFWTCSYKTLLLPDPSGASVSAGDASAGGVSAGGVSAGGASAGGVSAGGVSSGGVSPPVSWVESPRMISSTLSAILMRILSYVLATGTSVMVL